MYPPVEKLIEYAHQKNLTTKNSTIDLNTPNRSYEYFKKFAESDPLHELHEQVSSKMALILIFIWLHV